MDEPSVPVAVCNELATPRCDLSSVDARMPNPAGPVVAHAMPLSVRPTTIISMLVE